MFEGLRDRLREEDRESLRITLSDCPPHAWAFKTSVYLDFLWRSVDKFATGFEVVYSQRQPDFVT